MALNLNVNDTKNIPGLSGPWEKGIPFLTPVFFDIHVLVRYFYDPRYMCEFCSETYGTINCPEDPNYEFDFDFPFGINPNNKVIAWLGDINKLDPKEIQYLESNNIDSDGNIKSEFYEAQINAEFTDPIREVELVLFKTKLSKLTTELFGFSLYKTTEQEVSEIIGLCSKFKSIVFNSEDDIKRFLSYWNEELIEDLNLDGLKKVLTDNGVVIDKGNKGLKLLEKFIKNVLNVEENIIAPLYYLYDLRLWADHREMQSQYDNVLTNLKLKPDANFSKVYKQMIIEIYEFYKTLNDKLLDKNNVA
jgi:hypothetical protein